jgi:CrcB protein
MVLKSVILVLVGGGLGAVLREFMMLVVPTPSDKFPLDILVANVVASFMLGYVTGLYRRKFVSEGVDLLLGPGVTGGLSTFSSFAYCTVVLMLSSAASAIVASVYVLTSLTLGYLGVIAGLKLGGQRPTPRAARDTGSSVSRG